MVERWLESGQSQKRYCEEHGIKLHLLTYWARRYRDQQKEATDSVEQKFVSVELKDDQDLSSVMEIIYPNGVRLRFGSGVSLSTVKALLLKPY